MSNTEALAIYARAFFYQLKNRWGIFEGYENCQGIAKAGQYDCSANGHGYAGYAKTDGEINEWVYLPEGTYDKIVGDVVKAPKKETAIKS